MPASCLLLPPPPSFLPGNAPALSLYPFLSFVPFFSPPPPPRATFRRDEAFPTSRATRVRHASVELTKGGREGWNELHWPLRTRDGEGVTRPKEETGPQLVFRNERGGMEYRYRWRRVPSWTNYCYYCYSRGVGARILPLLLPGER